MSRFREERGHALVQEMSMRVLVSPLRRAALALGVLAAFAGAALAAEFPFGRELLLDVAPMKGSKRVPVLDIAPNGIAAIDLWCNSLQARLIVVADTITVLTGPKTERPCPADRAKGDEDMLSALSQATNWRLDGETLVLTGGATLRFRMQTN
jgi:heat shock protein HslJ